LENEIKIPSDVHEILKNLIEGIVHVERDFIKGTYVTGSIALQDYHPGKSDIDFVILCDRLPGPELQRQLAEVHRNIERKFKRSNLSGTYLTTDNLDIQQNNAGLIFSYHDGRLQQSNFDMGPLTLYELKTTAITLHGLPTNQLPISVQRRDVNRFLYENINSYWKTWLASHAAFHKQKLLLILLPRLTEWVILGLARQLYTLRTGKITSKTTAGFYCLEQLPDQYHHIVQEAIKIRTDTRSHMLHLKPSYYVQPSLIRATETLGCAQFMIDEFNREYNLTIEDRGKGK
jgi:hypothetical protein